MSSRFASLVLLDTEEHISLFRQRLDLTVTKFRRIFVGTDEDVFYPRKSEGKTSQFTVLFYGSMIPLQGVEFIIRAGALLRDEQIEFRIIGPQASTGFAQARTLADQLKADNIRFQDGVPYETLPDLIAEADICLGIFGTTEKAKSVIPNKAFEAIAMAKPLITGDSPAAREVFTSGQNVLLCQMGSPEALADAIRTLMNDDAFRQNIAKAGYKLFTENFTTMEIGLEVLRRIREAMSKVQKFIRACPASRGHQVFFRTSKFVLRTSSQRFITRRATASQLQFSLTYAWPLSAISLASSGAFKR